MNELKVLYPHSPQIRKRHVVRELVADTQNEGEAHEGEQVRRRQPNAHPLSAEDPPDEAKRGHAHQPASDDWLSSDARSRFGARLRHAASSAAATTAALFGLRAFSVTVVLPDAPHAPLTGANARG